MISDLNFPKLQARLSANESFSSSTEKRQKEIVEGLLSKEYMDLTCDWAIKYILNDDDILIMLLEDMLPLQRVDSVKRLPNELTHPLPDDKNIIFDVVCETSSGRMVVEMQRAKKTGFKNRMVYYGASLIQSELKKKSSYASLMPVYVICFMDFGFKGDKRIISKYALTEQETHQLYGDQLWIYLCNLKALKKNNFHDMNPQEKWLYMLKNMSTFAGKPEEWGERYGKVAEAARMPRLSADEKLEYVVAMLSEKEKMEIREAYYQDGFDDGVEKGIKKGIEQGIEKERLKNARNLLSLGVKEEIVVQATGLTMEEVLALRK